MNANSPCHTALRGCATSASPISTERCRPSWRTPGWSTSSCGLTLVHSDNSNAYARGLYCSCGTQRANRYVCTRAHMHTGARVKSLVQSLQPSGWQEGCGVPTSTLTINDQRRSGSAPIGMICAGGGSAGGSVAPTVRCTTKAFSLVDTFQQNTSALPVALDQEHDRPGSYALMAGAASHTHPRMRVSRFRRRGHSSVAVWLGGGYVEFLAHVLSNL